MLGTPELLVVGIVAVVLLFGAGKVPELARSLGQAMGEFKKAQREAELELKKMGDSTTRAEVPASKMPPQAEKKGEDVNIRQVARYMGIETEGKTDEELKKEVEAKLEATSQ
jgi:sec-independent protein translocase protein TatA